MGISSAGISDYVNTTDGRAYGISALNSGGTDSIGGQGLSVEYSNEPRAIVHILAQSGAYLLAENGNMLITQG